jgi:hypothetical protein
MTAPILSSPLRVWDNAAVLLHTGKRKGAAVDRSYREHVPFRQIEKLDRLKKAGSITDTEFARLRAKLVQ